MCYLRKMFFVFRGCFMMCGGVVAFCLHTNEPQFAVVDKTINLVKLCHNIDFSKYFEGVKVLMPGAVS